MSPAGIAATELDTHAIAARLSYFLWSSLPDRELLELAAEGRAGASPTSCGRRSSGC